MSRLSTAVAGFALIAAACGGGSGESTTTAPPTTAPSGTTTTVTTAAPAVPTTEAPAAREPITGGDGSYAIDWDALAGVVFFAPPSGGADPFFHVHNDPAADGFFFSVEAYTTGYGTAWTGELGDFTIDCSPAGTGICVHFDPDGAGPIGDLGADFMVTGDVTIVQADTEGFVAIFSDVEFGDGTAIPGPFTVTG